MGKVRLSVYVSEESKRKARKVLESYGLSISEAVNIFLGVIAETKRLPFSVEVPNDLTLKVMQEVLEGKNVEETSLESLLAEAEKA